MQLDGTGSSDADSECAHLLLVDYSRATRLDRGFDDPTSATPSFTPDVAGTYTIRLIVNDGSVASPPDTVTITATDDTGGGTLDEWSASYGLHRRTRRSRYWTFTANAGDRIAVHIGEITDTNDFRPWIGCGPTSAELGLARTWRQT